MFTLTQAKNIFDNFIHCKDPYEYSYLFYGSILYIYRKYEIMFVYYKMAKYIINYEKNIFKKINENYKENYKIKKFSDYKYLFYKKDNLINTQHNDNYIVSYKLKNKKNKITKRYYVYENISKYHIFIIEYKNKIFKIVIKVIKVKHSFQNNIIFILNKYELTYNGKFIYSLFNDS